LHTEFASVVDPIIGFIDDLRASHPDEQIVVLIPVVIPDRVRYRLLHNQIDLVLSNALRTRSDLIVARVTMPLDAARSAGPGVPEGPVPKEAVPSAPDPPAPARRSQDGHANFS
jgi:hypothetical protein